MGSSGAGPSHPNPHTPSPSHPSAAPPHSQHSASLSPKSFHFEGLLSGASNSGNRLQLSKKAANNPTLHYLNKLLINVYARIWFTFFPFS